MKSHVSTAFVKSLDKRTSVKYSCGVFKRMTPLHFNLNKFNRKKWQKYAFSFFRSDCDPFKWIRIFVQNDAQTRKYAFRVNWITR